ncbi:YopX family protein [Clostridium sporogenes]|uniref:YopX family protein n=1 Tax=Clostridium sporogenes TaxID=1509 RepID=UPI003F91BE6B
MREIKFRAWDKIDEKIREITLIDFEYKKVKLLNDYTGESYLRDFEEVILLEYTGLKDKNNKEIYEGDIVKIVSKVTGLFTKGKVVQGYGCFLVQYDWNTHLLCEFHNIEVIGNIYANPELVEV